MHRSIRITASAAAAAALAVLGTAGAVASPGGEQNEYRTHGARHVLLLSVDGLHHSDLAHYVAEHPHSAMADLVSGGSEFTSAQTTFPSDSFSGMVAQLTGGGSGTTGVYYDDTYNHALLAPGTTDCANTAPGTEVPWTEAANRSQSPITLDAGQGINSPALTDLPNQSKAATLANASAITAATRSGSVATRCSAADHRPPRNGVGTDRIGAMA